MAWRSGGIFIDGPNLLSCLIDCDDDWERPSKGAYRSPVKCFIWFQWKYVPLMDPFVVSIQKEKWNGKWERSGFSQLSFSHSHLELELDSVKNGEHTSQPTRRRDRARRTGFSSSFTYSRVAPNLFLSLRQRNLLFFVCRYQFRE